MQGCRKQVSCPGYVAQSCPVLCLRKGRRSMKRTTWLQDRRMQKFRDVLSRWERKELSAMEAGELLGCSERQFRRYRRRYEEEGLAGLVDRRLGKASLRRVPVASWCGCWANTARITWA